MIKGFVVELNYRGLPLEVSGKYYPGCAGSMYRSNGDPGDPPEDSFVSIDEIGIQGHAGETDDLSELFCDLKYNGTPCLDEIEDECLLRIAEDGLMDDDLDD